MSTIHHPQLPPPGAAQMPGYPDANGVPSAYVAGAQRPVPPMPPRARSAGFWVGATAAITAGVIAALLIGFFIGRGTRLSNDDVQGKLTQQQQADLIVQQKALNDQRTTMLTRQSKLLASARATSRAAGLREGRTEGRQQGYSSGRQAGYSEGQATGYSQGQNDGYSQGLDTGSCLINYLYC
jgi:hypothetical protein